ncbi:hypothetical protein SR64_01990 [Enterobacter hormaechei subsp. xiangfangensis]|nr:hypothetical protein AM329_21725 [Enterobacter cloacae complex sp. AR_0002]ASA04594.1 hypothetical protein AM432_12475 [Enterobacter cloacae complex sp.]AZU68725.1 hypothetical protein CLM87_19305 [Enterobacter hormaechei subsp. xiangfangensis]KJO95018.1 hypothetical protein SR93_09085 [Enterobacter hormaechei subsp. xiangfangensis]KJP23730.1 hypothetical protein SR64_01990 [Enterobacter hormaechei subsp. xiangfangensis]
MITHGKPLFISLRKQTTEKSGSSRPTEVLKSRLKFVSMLTNNFRPLSRGSGIFRENLEIDNPMLMTALQVLFFFSQLMGK